MTTSSVQQLLSPEAPLFPLSSQPKRTRISYFALLPTATCAALRKESRMQIIKATGLHRKSGGAKWRDLCVDALSWKCFRALQAAAKTLSGCSPGLQSGEAGFQTRLSVSQ
jgi:hypothetical protein